MIIGFDWDGTLVRSRTTEPLPSVRERLAALPRDARTFVATNQAGPVFRAITGEAKYPTVEDVATRLVGGFRALHWRPDLLLVCCAPPAEHQDNPRWASRAWIASNRLLDLLWDDLPTESTWTDVSHDPRWRKPAPGMLVEAASYFSVPRAEVLYIGDMTSDEAAALSVGVRYLDAAAWRAALTPTQEA